MTIHAEITQDVAAGRVEDALRRRVGRGKRYSFKTLSEHTGISERTLLSYTQGTAPGLAAFMTLCSFFGAGFASEVMGAAGFSVKDEGDETPEHMQVMTSLCSVATALSAALEDGKVDHREAAALREPAQNLIEKLEPLTRVTKIGAVA